MRNKSGLKLQSGPLPTPVTNGGRRRDPSPVPILSGARTSRAEDSNKRDLCFLTFTVGWKVGAADCPLPTVQEGNE